MASQVFMLAGCAADYPGALDGESPPTVSPGTGLDQTSISQAPQDSIVIPLEAELAESVAPPVRIELSAAPSPQTPPLAALPVVHSSAPAKPVIGGTLLITADGARAFAADPDRSVVFVARLSPLEALAIVPLEDDDEPGRLVEGPFGEVFVALRRGGAIAVVNPLTLELQGRYPACAAPRGLAFDAERDQLVVACLSGELLALAPTTGDVLWRRTLVDDLRDVQVTPAGYVVSRMKSAELLLVEPDAGAPDDAGSPAARRPPTLSLEAEPLRDDAGFLLNMPGVHEPRVLRRTAVLADSTVLLFHQRANRGRLVYAYYGAQSGDLLQGGVVHGALTLYRPQTDTFVEVGALESDQFYDVAVSRDESRVALLSLGLTDTRVTHKDWATLQDQPTFEYSAWDTEELNGQGSALAYDAQGRLLVQFREPAAIEVVDGERLEFVADSRFDTGQVLFHASTSRGVACTSCHPEGGEDGVTWLFGEFGYRQTQPLQGGLLSTLPLHWRGELTDMTELLADTYVSRMGGASPDLGQGASVGLWLDELPFPTALPTEGPAVASGQEIFERAGCRTCHDGPAYTDNLNHDVGTGGVYQTPPLRGLRHSAPYMHDGCAATLGERFDEACGGVGHGAISELGEDERATLVTFLRGL